MLATRLSSLTQRFILMGLSCLLLAGCAAKEVPEVHGPQYFYDKGTQALAKKRYLEAIENFQRLVSNFPGSALVSDAQYQLAESYYGMEDFVNAVFEYQRLIDTYPSSEWADEAAFQIGEAFFEQRRRPELDQSETYEALTAYRRFLEDHPSSPMVSVAQERIVACRERLAKKEFLGAQLYHRQGHLEAARMSYDQLLISFPDTDWYLQGLAHLGLLERDEGGLEAARLHWQQVVDNTQDDELRAQVQGWLTDLDTP
ncbi:MAG: outer membrane protein assembly factor BamD [Candidatus Latescibacterota bacterium]|jgi:outer membrane protein assembly factor BamD|nr:outer membrane protein assembly factor BamD [Candidatus Latescibacterota bacterium]